MVSKHKELYPVKLFSKGESYAVNVPVYLCTYNAYIDAEDLGLNNPIIHIGLYKGASKWIAYELTTGLMVCTGLKRTDVINRITDPVAPLLPRVVAILKSKKGQELAAEFDRMKAEGPILNLSEFMLMNAEC